MHGKNIRKVLILTEMWPTDSNPISGIFVQQQAQEWLRQGYDVQVVLLWPAGKKKPVLRGLSAITHRGDGRLLVPQVLKVLRLPSMRDSMLSIVLNSIVTGVLVRVRLTRKLPESAIILVHGLRYASLSALFWGKGTHARTAHVIHGVDTSLAKPPNVTKRLTRRALNSCDWVFPVGRPLLDWLGHIGVNMNRVIVIPNGTTLPDYVETRHADRGGLKLSAVANLHPLKGIDVALKAVAEAQESGVRVVRFDIVGDGPQRSELQAMTETLGLGHVVQFHGRLSYDSSMAILGQADFLVLPSWGDSFGIVYLEAMSRGVIPIGCRASGAEETIKHGVNGFLVPRDDASSIANILAEAAQGKYNIGSIQAHCFSVARNFTWERNVARLAEVLGQKSPTE